MQSKASTVEQYLAELPEDRRDAIGAVRRVILKNLDPVFQETMQYGMIGYSVPHAVFPDGYHCDPRQPLPFAALGSQKNHMALYLMCLYGECAPGSPGAKNQDWFREAWAKTGKKLDMGKSCIRFKKVEDLALDVIGEVLRRVPAKKWIEIYRAAMDTRGAAKKRPAKPAARRSTKAPSRSKAAR